MNYYELLEVTPNASTEVIKNAYKTLAKKFHPDTYSGDRTFAEEKMKLLNEAIAVLGNEEKRKLYNEENNIGIYSNISTMFSSADSTDSFIEEMDNFLNKKSKKTDKNEKERYSKTNSDTINIDDIDDGDMDSIDNLENEDENTESSAPIKYTKEELRNIISNEYYDDDEDNKIEEYTRKLKKSRTHSKTKVGKWYYITVCVMIALNILLIFLITRTFNLGNIKNFFSARASDAGNIGGEKEFAPEYNLENSGGMIDGETTESEIATEPTIESDYALAALEDIPVPRAEDEDSATRNVTLPPQTQPPQTQAPATKAAVTTPVPVPKQKPPAAPAPTVPATIATEPVTEPQTVEIIIAIEETTEEIIEQETTVLADETETQESETEDNITTEAEPENINPETETETDMEISETETIPPDVQPEYTNTESVTDAPIPAETQNEEQIIIENEVDIVEH